MSFELKTCPLCEGQSHEQIYLAKDRHYGIPGLYPIVRCADCSLVFLNPMYSDEELSSLYPKDYYAYQNNFHRNRWKETLKTILRCRTGTQDPTFPVPGRMLDLGCGSGWFMSDMRDQGWETHGVEISSPAAELGRKTAALNIFSGTLEQAVFPPEFFDYVRSNHSFEHIARPKETLDEIHRVLKRGGKLLIGVPNEASLTSRVFGPYWWYRGAPVHPFTYSVKTLCELLKKQRFVIEKVVYNSNCCGILGSFQIWLNRGNLRKSSEGVVFNKHLLRILCHWTAKLTDLLKLGDEIEITAMRASDYDPTAQGHRQRGIVPAKAEKTWAEVIH
jgi:SAM-dependent methyltransferase